MPLRKRGKVQTVLCSAATATRASESGRLGLGMAASNFDLVDAWLKRPRVARGVVRVFLGARFRRGLLHRHRLEAVAYRRSSKLARRLSSTCANAGTISLFLAAKPFH